MAGWDPSLVDPTLAPADALVIRSPGGRTGSLNLENGASLAFPWKSQQEISGSTPASINAVEVTSAGVHKQDMYLAGPSLVSGTAAPFLRLSTAYSDDTNPNRRQVVLSTDGTSRLDINSYSSTGGAVTLAGGSGHLVQVTSSNEVRLTATSSPVTVQADQYLTLRAGVNYTGTSTDFASVVIQTENSAYGVVSIQPLTNNAVRANGYPIVPLRAVENAAVGTAPSVTAVAPAYKMVAGRQSVSFGSSGGTTSGAGTLTLPSSQFATGLLCIVCTAERNDFVVAHNRASSTKTAIALTGFDAGVSADIAVTIDYIAIGW